MGGFGGLVATLLWGVLVAVAVGDPAPDPPSHLLAEVLMCQPDSPSRSLSVTLDGQLLYAFDFPGSRWNPGIPSLPPRPSALETPQEILPEAQLCQEILQNISQALTGKVPEARGIPMVSVFPALPPVPGEPNTLVCVVENIFPPALDISWTLAGVPVTQGVTHSPYTPTAELTFVRFSYVPFVPAAGDVHACVVTSRRDNATVVTYWVAPDTALDEQLDAALAGAAMALGIVLAVLGVILVLVARRGRGG
ncbi:class II histocompatibility antigen, M alpha chain-like [Corvus moneduloides]|uniref:class II histocompatibility antigen, M alpha chain-like n=1 Tax=Corvus moneduloides TaxID=1196302 RepID=UPI001362EE58|nr:class II histocompatibility antigen, M alpha chain-like [Corvus moneduloides]